MNGHSFNLYRQLIHNPIDHEDGGNMVIGRASYVLQRLLDHYRPTADTLSLFLLQAIMLLLFPFLLYICISLFC